MGSVCWRIRDRNQTLWQHIECLSFCLVAINFLYFPVTNWKDCFLSATAFGFVLFLTHHFTIFFRVDFSPELKQPLLETRSRSASYNLYKSGAFLLGWRNMIYSIVVPLAGFTAFARTDPQILRYYLQVLTYSLFVSTLIHALFIRKAGQVAQKGRNLVSLPPFIFQVLIGIFLLGLVYELVSRRRWFFYSVSVFFFFFVLKTLPTYVQRSRAVLSQVEEPPYEWANQFIRTLFLEILFVLPYGIVLAFTLALLAALSQT